MGNVVANQLRALRIGMDAITCILSQGIVGDTAVMDVNNRIIISGSDCGDLRIKIGYGIAFFICSRKSLGIIVHVSRIGFQEGAEINHKIMFMGNKSVFRGVLVATDIWKGFGWGSILYLAAIAGVDQEMYEASRIDGANKFQNAWYITIPSILPVICINLILSLSGILNAGFDQIFNMYSAVVYEVADIIDTYVYRLGLANMQYSLSTAVGLFKSVVGLIFILAVNSIIRRLGGRENSLW